MWRQSVESKMEDGTKKQIIHSIPAVEFECWSCHTRSYDLKVCSGCQVVRYCNTECQKKHWSQHKQTCKKDMGAVSGVKGGSFVEVSQEKAEDEKPELYFVGLDSCIKNGHNKHANFISVEDFNIGHLPEPLKRHDVVKYIKAESNMTVRVKVKFTSLKRPDSDACAKHRGTRFARTASGLYVLDNPHWFQSTNCTVPNCHRLRDLGENHSVYQGDLKIFTNKHVVFDEEELSKTTVDFFYNSDDKKGIVLEYGVQLFYLNAKSDKAFIKVTIHDENMFQRLYQLDCDRANCFRDIPKSIIDKWAPYAILISHPHGMPKKISIGKINEIREENVTEESLKSSKEAARLQKKWYSSFQHDDYIAFMKCLGMRDMPVFKMWYDTPSCPGSSGGPVLFGGAEVEGVRGPYVANHSGYDLDSTLNFFKVVKLIKNDEN